MPRVPGNCREISFKGVVLTGAAAGTEATGFGAFTGVGALPSIEVNAVFELVLTTAWEFASGAAEAVSSNVDFERFNAEVSFVVAAAVSVFSSDAAGLTGTPVFPSFG